MAFQGTPIDSAFEGLLGTKLSTSTIRPGMKPERDLYPGSYLPVTEQMCTTCIPPPKDQNPKCAACSD